MKRLDKIKNKINTGTNGNALLLLSFLFFIFMMMFRLTHSALWGDELVEYFYSQRSIRTGALYEAIASTYQPPLYNFVMHFWLKINGSLFWFRFFNVVLGAISFFSLYGALRHLVDCKKACASLVILAVCHKWIYCIQECSEYALMLCGLSMALYFYVTCLTRFSYAKMLAFVLSCVIAIYSQYGAAFVIVPLLSIFFCKITFSDEHPAKRKISVAATYLFSAFAFALPLYIFFAKIQMKRHAIADNSIHLTANLLKDIPFIIGKIFAWLFSFGDTDIVSAILGVLGLIFLSIIINTFIRKSENPIKKSLLLCMLATYVMHYILVQLHIYAMLHPGQSSGFYCRYSYFYMPLMTVVLPLVYDEFKKLISQNSILKLLCMLLAGTVVSVSFIGTLQNWHKSYVDQIGQIWVDHQGWKDVTYLYGGASPWGIRFYASKSDQCPTDYLNKVTRTIDHEHLPDRFWAWGNDWGTHGWEATLDEAKKQGYTVEIYVNHKDKGKLAYCYKAD